ncbi:uncharacterized protein LOC134816655 [Bolinopsis microptera]|uniref:uncharacterized protein LOC134816655 n=1 Tax=Bolinopsis microptera TaxID=2820187 RepID=UPI00307A47B7
MAGSIWFLFYQTMLPSLILGELICNHDGVKCVAEPSGCTADCGYLLMYKAESASTTSIQISGNRSEHNLLPRYSDLWLAFGFSLTGRMGGMTAYVCHKYGENYTATKRPTRGQGMGTPVTNVAVGAVDGAMVDGVMTCKYTISNSDLPSGNLRMGYGLGPVSSKDGILRMHHQIPKKTTHSFSLVQQIRVHGGPCGKPGVPEGLLTPSLATVESGGGYTVSCNTGFLLSGPAGVTCIDGILSDLPSCNHSPTENESPTSPGSGTVSRSDSAWLNYQLLLLMFLVLLSNL